MSFLIRPEHIDDDVVLCNLIVWVLLMDLPSEWYCWRNGAKFTKFIFIHIHGCYCYSRIYSHSTTKFTFKKYICLHLTTYFSFMNIFTDIYGMYRSHSTAYIRSHSRSKYPFNTVQYSFNIFSALPLRIVKSQLPAAPGELSLRQCHFCY